MLNHIKKQSVKNCINFESKSPLRSDLNYPGDKLTDWNGGTYSNKNGPNFLVPKASPGNGCRLNLGNPKAVMSFILMIIVLAILIIGSILIS